MLVDRIWPRGLTKEHASVDEWLKDIAPSAGLRTWFGHDPNCWREFHKRYFEELRANHAAVEHLTDLASAGEVTLLFGALRKSECDFHNQSMCIDTSGI